MIARFAVAPKPGSWGLALLVLMSGVAVTPRSLEAQRVLTESQQVITVAKGKSALFMQARPLQRVTVADSTIADPVLINPQELLVNGKTIGTTSLIVWHDGGQASIYAVEVTADAGMIERQLQLLFPETPIRATATGNNIILSGQVNDATIARRAVEIAATSGATVVNNLQAPSAEQILLHVRFAEVSRSAALQLGTGIKGMNVDRLEPGADATDQGFETLSSGLVKLFLLGDNTSIDVVIEALRSRGQFRSLAEPNLLALEGQEASFLAGGEFPFPVIQSGATTGGLTVVWKEFGIRLKFTPHVTNTGSIRLAVEPEVSSLDFANGLEISGFRIPSILSRRAHTEVELRPGQHLAIAGLLDNTLLDNVSKIPVLGDIPVLGQLFRSKDARQNRTELLVLVTPYIVEPTDTPPPLPTGEPETWDWMRGLRPQDLPKPNRPPYGGNQP